MMGTERMLALADGDSARGFALLGGVGVVVVAASGLTGCLAASTGTGGRVVVLGGVGAVVAGSGLTGCLAASTGTGGAFGAV